MNEQSAVTSVFALLRGLVPRRPLTRLEALRIAELQAAHLRQHFAIKSLAAPDEIVTELPRIRVEREYGLPVSGAAHWNGRYWVISLNADDHPLRQRFSLMHEFKHIIDHTTADYLYRDLSLASAQDQAERVADHFAACVLMPKVVVIRLWCGGQQNIRLLANTLRVSSAALRYRLDQLGLTTPEPRRCDGPRRARKQPLRLSIGRVA